MMDHTLSHLTNLLNKDKEFCWTLEDAVEVCRILEPIAPTFGAHVALTGGCLYKDGKRKDADILFYRIRQLPAIDEVGLLESLKGIGFVILERKGWVVKVLFEGKPIDFFFPEELKTTITGKCLDDQYPEGPECPNCHKERIFDVTRDRWVHKNSNLVAPVETVVAAPVVYSATCFRCMKEFYHMDDCKGGGLCPDCLYEKDSYKFPTIGIVNNFP